MGLYLPLYLVFIFNPWTLPPEFCSPMSLLDWNHILAACLILHPPLFVFPLMVSIPILNPRTESELLSFLELLICTGAYWNSLLMYPMARTSLSSIMKCWLLCPVESPSFLLYFSLLLSLCFFWWVYYI